MFDRWNDSTWKAWVLLVLLGTIVVVYFALKPIKHLMDMLP